MRAILNATGYSVDMLPMVNYRPTPLMQICDKPIIFYIIEYLVRLGVKKLDIILSHLPRMVEDKLGYGERWGISLNYYLVRVPDYPFNLLVPLARSWGDENVLLGEADSLPQFEGKLNVDNLGLYMLPDNSWSGWGVMPAKAFIDLPRELPYRSLPQYIEDKVPKLKADPFLSTRTYNDLHKSNIEFIKNIHPNHLFRTSAHQVEPGIWISRSVALHPKIKLVAPVFIGEDTRIMEESTIGPQAIIGKHCIIDKGASIQNSVVCKRSYVGEKIDVNGCIVDRNLLVNLALDTNIEINDEFILSEIKPFTIHNRVLSFFSRSCAVFVGIVFLPILLILLITCKIKKKEVLRLPASLITTKWRTFEWYYLVKKNGTPLAKWSSIFRHWPNLWNVIKGNAHLVGVTPRSVEEVENLPPDWRKLYLQSKIGIATLAGYEHGRNVSDDELYASEAYYTANIGLVYDFKILFKNIIRKLSQG